MAADLFIELTMPLAHGYDSQPITINVTKIITVNPRCVRKEGTILNGPEAFEIRGTYVCTGESDEHTVAVTEDYGVVTRMMRDALRD